MAEKVVLTYFDGRGKMESIRWLLAAAEVEVNKRVFAVMPLVLLLLKQRQTNLLNVTEYLFIHSSRRFSWRPGSSMRNSSVVSCFAHSWFKIKSSSMCFPNHEFSVTFIVLLAPPIGWKHDNHLICTITCNQMKGLTQWMSGSAESISPCVFAHLN